MLVASSHQVHVSQCVRYAVWTRTEGGNDTDVQRTVELGRQMHSKYRRAIRTGDCLDKQIENVGGSMHASLLCMHNRWETVVMCILHNLMAFGKYLSVWICKRSHLWKPARRTRLATPLRRAKAGVVLAGKGAPDGEESCYLLAHWEEIAQLLGVGPNTKKAVAHMYMLLQNLKSTPYHAKALKFKTIVENLRQAISPTERSTTSCGWRNMHAVCSRGLRHGGLPCFPLAWWSP